MIGQLFVILLVFLKGLLLPFLLSTVDFGLGRFVFKGSLNDKKLRSMLNILCISGIKAAFAQRKVVNGVKDVGFALTIISQKHIYTGVKIKVFALDVLEIQYGQAF